MTAVPQRTYLAIAAVFVVLYAVTIWALYFQRDGAAFLLSEGGPYETIGYLSCFAAAALLIVTFIRYRETRGILAGRRNYWLLALGLAFLFLGLEEISWGQHLFGFSTPPGIAEVSLQRETNLHNLAPVHLLSHAIGLILWAIYCVLVPLACAASSDIERLCRHLSLPVPSLGVAFLFATAMIAFQMVFAPFYARSPGTALNYGEMQEGLYQFAALVCALEFYLQRKAVAVAQGN